jgi:hypothetical protein
VRRRRRDKEEAIWHGRNMGHVKERGQECLWERNREGKWSKDLRGRWWSVQDSYIAE